MRPRIMENRHLRFVWFLVGLGLLDALSVEPNNEKGTDPQEIRENLRNLLDSIGGNNAKKIEAYRNILGWEAAQEKQMFDAVKEDWRSARAGKLPNLHDGQKDTGGRAVAALKREVPKSESEMEEPIIFPTSDMDFESAVKAGATIVDKTRFIKQLLHPAEKVKLMLRPGQFGKSFFLSMLKSFFLNQRRLFKNFVINEGRNVRKAFPWKKYPVVHLSFSTFHFHNPKDLERCLIERLMMIAADLNVPRTNTSVPLEEAVRWLFTRLEGKYGSEIILLIDDYDTPYRTTLQSHAAHREIWAVLGTFYRALKNIGSFIKFTFITGCLKVGPATEENFAADISQDPSYSEMMGITEAEVNKYYGTALIRQIKQLVKPAPKSDGEVALLAEQMKANLTAWYNGHRFTTKSTRICPPMSVISFLKELPSKVVPYWPKIGTAAVEAVIQAMRAFPVHTINTFVMDLENERTYNITGHDLHSPINVSELETDFANVIKLLYRIGYFTIKSTEGSVYYVGCTNAETREVLLECVRSRVLLVVNPRDWLTFFETASNCETQENFEIFFSAVETVIPDLGDSKKAYRLFIPNHLSRNNVGKALEGMKQQSKIRYVSSDGKKHVTSKRSDFVFDENPWSTFIIDYRVYPSMYGADPLEQCIKYHVPMFKNNGKRISCIGVLFANKNQKVKKAGNARILNWKVITFREDHSTILGKFQHPTPYARFQIKIKEPLVQE